MSHHIFDDLYFANRRWFLQVCRASYAQQFHDVDYNDGETLDTLLIKMGLVDLYNEEALNELDTHERHGLSITTRSEWYYRPDENRRIVKIGLISGGKLSILPMGIRHLDRLTSPMLKMSLLSFSKTCLCCRSSRPCVSKDSRKCFPIEIALYSFLSLL